MTRTELRRFIRGTVGQVSPVSFTRQGAPFVSLYCWRKNNHGLHDHSYTLGMN